MTARGEDNHHIMKLCYLALEAPREGSAAYTHVSEIIAGLQSRGWQIDLVAPEGRSAWERPRLAARIWEYLALQVRLAWRLQRYDIVYVRSHFLALPIALTAWALRIRIVHEINGPYDDVFVTYPAAIRYRRLLEGMQRLQYQLADGLTAVTEGLSIWAERESRGRPVRLISNAANTSIFSPDATAVDGQPDRYVVFFGGFAKWHGIDTMLEAVLEPDWPRDVHLVLIGDGTEAAKVAALANRVPLVHWLGRRGYRELPPIIVGALASLVPITDPHGRSRTGLAPLKMFEALACGVPVVVSDLPGQADFIRTAGCGVVFPSGDAVALAQAVARLAADPEGCRRMGYLGRDIVAREHSWESRAADLHEHLCAVIRADETGKLARRGPHKRRRQLSN